jgi:hypothetical protein
MGDRGGRKAKDKQHQQGVSKQKEKQRLKDGKSAAKAPAATARGAAAPM